MEPPGSVKTGTVRIPMLVSSGYCNKIWTEWLKQRHLLLPVLVGGSLRSECQCHWVLVRTSWFADGQLLTVSSHAEG